MKGGLYSQFVWRETAWAPEYWEVLSIDVVGHVVLDSSFLISQESDGRIFLEQVTEGHGNIRQAIQTMW